MLRALVLLLSLLFAVSCVTTEPDPTGIEHCEHVVRKHVLYAESFKDDSLKIDYLREQGIGPTELRECRERYPISTQLVEVRTIIELAPR